MANFFPISGGLQILNDSPVDSRYVVADQTARLGLPAAVVFKGLLVFQADTSELYILEDISQANHVDGWTQVSSNGVEDIEYNDTTGVLTITLEDGDVSMHTIPHVASGSVTDGVLTLSTQTGTNIVVTGNLTGPQGLQGPGRFTVYQVGDVSTTPNTPNATSYDISEDFSSTNGQPAGWTITPDSPASGQATYAITVLYDAIDAVDGVVTLTWSNVFIAGSAGPSGPAGVSITGATVPQSGDDQGKIILSRNQGQPDIVTRVIAGDTLGNFQVNSGQLSFDITEGDGTVVPQGPFTISGISSGDAITVYSTAVTYEQNHLVANVDTNGDLSIYQWGDAVSASNVPLTDVRWRKLLDTADLATDTELTDGLALKANLAGASFTGDVNVDGVTTLTGRTAIQRDGGENILTTGATSGDIHVYDENGNQVSTFDAQTGQLYANPNHNASTADTSSDSKVMRAGGLEVGATSVGHVDHPNTASEDAQIILGYEGTVISRLPIDGVITSTAATDFIENNQSGRINFVISDTVQASDEKPVTSAAVNTYAQEDLGIDPADIREDSDGNISLDTDLVLEDNHAIDFDDSSNNRAGSIRHSDTNNGLEIEAVATNENIYLLPNGTGNAYVGSNATGNRIVVASELEGVGGELTAAASYTQTNVTYGVDGAGDPTLVFQTLNSNVAIGNFVQAAGFDLSADGSTSVETYTGTFTFSIGNTQYSVAPTAGNTFTWNYDSATDGTGSGSLTFDGVTSTPAAPGTAVSGTIVANFGDSPFTHIQAGTGTTLTVDSDNNLTISSEGGSGDVTGKLDTNLGNVATLTEGQGLAFSEAIHSSGIFTWPVLTGDVSHIDDFNAAFAAQVGNFTLRQGTAWSFGGFLWQWRSSDINITNSNFGNINPALTHGGWRRLAYTIWNNLYTYQAGNVVSYQNGGGWHEYICIVDGAGGGGGSELTPPNNPTEWQLLGNEFNPTEYDPTQVYSTGDLVTADGELFQCTATTTAQPGNSTIETEGDNWRSITETLASVDSVATFPLLTPSNSIIRVGEIMCVINDPSPYNNGLYRVISHNASGTSVARVDELNDLHEIVEGIIQHSGSSASFEFPDDNPAFITGTLVDETLFTTVEGTKSTSIPSLDTVGPKFEPDNGRMTLIYSNLSDTQITQLEAAVGSDLAFRTTAGGIVTTGNVEDTDNAVAAQSTYHFLLKSVSYRLGTGRRQLNFVMRDLSQATDFVSAFSFEQNTGLTGNAGNLYIPTDGPLVTNLIDNISLVTIVAISGGGGGFTNGQIVDLGTGSTLNSVAIATTNDVPDDYIKSIDHPTLGQITITEVIGGVEQSPETISTDHVYYRSEYSEADWGTAGMPANTLGLPGALAFDNTTDPLAAVAYRKNSTGSLGTWVILPLAVSSTVVTGWSNPGGTSTNPVLQPTASGQNAVIGKHDGTLTIDDIQFDALKYTAMLIGVGPDEITTTAAGYETDGLSYAHNGITYYRLFASDGLTEILTTNQNNTDTGDIVYTKTY